MPQPCSILPHVSPKDLCCHDEAGSVWMQLNIPGQQPHILKCILEIAELLVGKSLDWGSVNGSGKRGRTERATSYAEEYTGCQDWHM